MKLNIDILNWYLIKGMPSKKKLWTFPKSKLGFQNNNFGPKNHQNFLKKSMDIHGWPTYLLKICPNFFSGKNMASTDPTYLWFGICPKFRSFFLKAFLTQFRQTEATSSSFRIVLRLINLISTLLPAGVMFVLLLNFFLSLSNRSKITLKKPINERPSPRCQ